MSKRRLSLLDSTFLRIETPETPMHVSLLMTFRLPEGSGPDVVGEIVARLREEKPLRRPWNLVLSEGIGSKLAPATRVLETLDMEYHIRHTALPRPGGERELGELVSHLHSSLLDRTRPLWTCHVIEGLGDERFAIFIKCHHALTDGVNGIRLATQSLARTPEGSWIPPWHADSNAQQRRWHETIPRPRRNRIGAAIGTARGLLSIRDRGAEGGTVQLPFSAPRSALNLPVTNARRVATQQLDIARLQRVARRHQVSLNDVFLALCGDALRSYLGDRDLLPRRALVAGVPVSLREEGQVGGNSVGYLWSTLATDAEDPHERLDSIRRSMKASKDHLKAMDPAARPAFTLATMALPTVSLLSGQAARLPRPPMNVTISNVPGPQDLRYVAGAELEAIYPISLVFQGMGLNITCVSYAGSFNVGVVGSRDSLPSLQHIAVGLSDALERLESPR